MTPKFTYAGRLERFAAFLIDKFILLVPTMLLAGLFVPEAATESDDTVLLPSELGLLVVIELLCTLAYFTWFVGSRWQASPGQRIMGMHVVHADGSPLDLRDAAARFLAFILPTLPLYSSFISASLAQTLAMWLIGVWFLPILFRDERTGMHDILCNTRMVAGKAKGS